MNRADRAAWRSARTLGDLCELVVRWLNGEIEQTPCHMGPPERETIPLIPALTAVNRGGFITTCSQLAESMNGETWNTWVEGFVTTATLQRLRDAVAGTPLNLAACRRRVHEHRRSRIWACCLWRDETGWWAEACPAAADLLRDCWIVCIEDPEDGRNDLLWDTLTRALAGRAA